MFFTLGRNIARAALSFAKSDHKLPSSVKVVALPELQGVDARFVSEFPRRFKELAEPLTERLRMTLPQVWAGTTQTDLTYMCASAVAHNLKRYGPGCPSLEFRALLEARCLDCSNYGLLTFYISLLLLDEADRKKLWFVGWDGGVVGSHQMLFLLDNNERPHLALDPTLGIACLASFDEIASGKPISPDSIVLIAANDQLKDSRDAFVRALLEGRFRPSDLLYCFHGAEDLMLRYGNPFDWPTPAVVVLRNRHHANT